MTVKKEICVSKWYLQEKKKTYQKTLAKAIEQKDEVEMARNRGKISLINDIVWVSAGGKKKK